MIEDVGRFDVGMPPGATQLALAYAARGAAAARRLTGAPWAVSASAVVGHLLLPLVVGDRPASSAPRSVPGGGWVHADLIADDEELFAVLAADAPGADAEELAITAQECRLPVTPYRRAPARWRLEPPEAADVGERLRRVSSPASVRVVDLTAMWAGPLCTALLAAWGARVLTVEPPSRRDGLRGSPAQFAVLDHGKARRPWDLRMESGRAAFEAALREADVLVESFSDRVLPNLGYDDASLTRLNHRLNVVRVRAFPSSSAEASWVAFGRGVHAVSGLGFVDGAPAPATVAYPDPLAGLLAFAAVLEALARLEGGQRVEVSLAGAIAPLLGASGAALGAVDDASIAAARSGAARRPGAILLPGESAPR